MAYSKKFEDFFTETVDTQVSAHTPDMGVGYTAWNDHVRRRVDAASDTVIAAWYASGVEAQFAANISGTWAEKQKAEFTTGWVKSQLYVRLQSDGAGSFNGFMLQPSSARMRVYRVDSGVLTELSSWVGDWGLNTDVWELEIDSSDNLKVYKNSTELTDLAVTDTTYSGGAPGFGIDQSVLTDGIDNFRGWDEAAAGGATLSINGAVNSQTADQVVLSQFQTLNVADGVHSQSADQVTPTQIHPITIAESNHGLISDSLTLAQTHPLTIADGVHALTTDAVLLGQIQTLVIQNATHGLMSDVAGLFDPTAFTPNPDRTHKAIQTGRTSSPTSGDRTTQPTNNRTLRI